MYGVRFGIVYAALALVLAGSAFAGYRGLNERPTPHCAGAAATDPIVTAVEFIHTAVERKNPAAGYALATPSLRKGTTCADWARGSLPVAAYREVDWDKASYRVEARGDGQIVLKVLLSSRTLPEPTKAFLLELRQVGDRWLVGFWGPA